MTSIKIPAAEAQMKIRKPIATVFQAFVDPAITTQFWFTKSSGILEKGKTFTWEWEMYGVSWDVNVKEIINNQRIVLDEFPAPTTIEFDFKTLSDGFTYVTVKQYGFKETGDDLLEKIKDATGGWTTVLDGAKAFLEYHIHLNLVADKFPKELSNHEQ